jgi:tetratricopeptide (TPR) repeat protein
MDNDDLSILPEKENEKNEIYQDDVPIDSLLYHKKSKWKPTPLDVTRLWSEGYNLTDQMKDALVSILLNRINIAIYLNRVSEAETILKAEFENAKNDTAKCARILVSLVLLFERIVPEKAKSYYSEAKMIISGNEKLLDGYTRNIWKILNAGREIKPNPQILRVNAFEHFEKKEFAEAEKIYRQMIDLDFDLPGTYCHLARVQLMTGQEDEAGKSVTRAWELKEKAAGYVVPRIIFLQILLLMLNKQDFSFWIKKINGELRKPYSAMEWHIQPLLENIMPRLTHENNQVLSTLAEFLQSKTI